MYRTSDALPYNGNLPHGVSSRQTDGSRPTLGADVPKFNPSALAAFEALSEDEGERVVRDYLKDHGYELVTDLIAATRCPKPLRLDHAYKAVAAARAQFEAFITDVAMDELNTTCIES